MVDDWRWTPWRWAWTLDQEAQISLTAELWKELQQQCSLVYPPAVSGSVLAAPRIAWGQISIHHPTPPGPLSAHALITVNDLPTTAKLARAFRSAQHALPPPAYHPDRAPIGQFIVPVY